MVIQGPPRLTLKEARLASTDNICSPVDRSTTSSSKVTLSTVNNSELDACIAGRIRTWLFPKPKGGGQVVVTYPFIFHQAGK